MRDALSRVICSTMAGPRAASVFTLAVLSLLAGPVFVAGAAAHDGDCRRVPYVVWKPYRVCNDFTGHCRIVRERVTGWRCARSDVEGVDEDRPRERDSRNCREMRRAVGDQHLTVDGAKKAANDAWAGMVRFHLGEKFMDLANARRVVHTCSRSSIKEGGVTTLGQTLTRCEIEAVPCAPLREAGERN